jgi:hypothetical protein
MDMEEASKFEHSRWYFDLWEKLSHENSPESRPQSQSRHLGPLDTKIVGSNPANM